MQKQGESLDSYRTLLEDDVGKMQKMLYETTGEMPTTFTYPYGYISKSSKEILKNMGFRATLSCSEGLNYITRDPESLYHMKRVCRSPEESSAQFFKAIAPPLEKKAEQAEQ
jgi:peptidoglycan/xylan/chitin deacetylase (PgdA/CDA1 family)